MMPKILSLFVALFILSTFALVAHGDHQGPERIVDGKYSIFLSITPSDNNSLNLRFFFNDAQTGKRLPDITATVSISGENGTQILNSESIEVKDGVAELIYTFPASGLFEVFLEFRKNGEIYRPEEWSVWVPGKDGVGIGASYPFGLSEIVSIGLLGSAIILVAWSYISNKKKK